MSILTWIIIIAFLAGMLTAGLILLLVFSLMAASAREQEALENLEPPHYAP